ncbi:MAG: Stk1 family PASTA domain-containing Ser/Thr kinase, partial [Angustibacter sp.]
MNSNTRLLGGRYEVGELLGRGGMADVHLGRDARLGRTVAIKMLRSDLARDPSFQARFRREAQSAAGLNHPAVVAVYDSGEDLDPHTGVTAPYIVMEYVEGRTLRELLTQGQRLPWAEALRLTSGVLAALGYSHTAGIVHRDIKPANVMLTPTGDVKVMDFGIARALADSSATMTQTQAVIGTAQYLSPEQARGETVDARSDLYSTGCLLFELITGRPPFVADSPVAVAYQHVGEIPSPPSSLVPDVPAAVDSIVLHALVKDREDRYQSAEEFRQDVESALAGRPISAAANLAAQRGGGATTVALSAVTGLGPPAASTSLLSLPGALPAEEPAPRRRQDRQEPPSRTGLWIFLGVLAVAVLAAGGLILNTNLKNDKQAPPTTVQVPELMGLTVAEAKRELTPLGITLGEESRSGSDKYPK